MRVAETLSDLTSLQVCDYDAALHLVKAVDRAQDEDTSKSDSSATKGDADHDLSRVEALVKLHKDLKTSGRDSTEQKLRKARQRVERAAQLYQMRSTS